jgi:hypothetical protein
MQNNKYYLIDKTDGVCTLFHVTFPRTIVDYLVKHAHHYIEVLSPTENKLYFEYRVDENDAICCEVAEIGQM